MDQSIWRKDLKDLEKTIKEQGFAVTQNRKNSKDIWIVRKQDLDAVQDSHFPWKSLVYKWTTLPEYITSIQNNNKSLLLKLKNIRKVLKNEKLKKSPEDKKSDKKEPEKKVMKEVKSDCYVTYGDPVSFDSQKLCSWYTENSFIVKPNIPVKISDKVFIYLPKSFTKTLEKDLKTLLDRNFNTDLPMVIDVIQNFCISHGWNWFGVDNFPQNNVDVTEIALSKAKDFKLKTFKPVSKIVVEIPAK